ncbi:response regulator [Pseudoalteromonas luteoviolacea]|uniref:hybrid sensor histidine kinase/response regulator n=1 Tax=Pseudoalteromonas luteoviolacea TaxID=43657 RepID=UPI001B3892AC|nr:response regulator [Pseudoalteromonas luteoviolacea]
MKYLIEAILLGLIWFFGFAAIDAYHLLNRHQHELELKSRLNLVATELSLETLSAMDSNIYHFDRHAQKQLEFERYLQELDLNNLLNQDVATELDKFQVTIDTYMQLASMLKTSYRYIAKQELERGEYAPQSQNIISEVVSLVSNLMVTNSIPVIERVRAKLEATLPALAQLEEAEPRFRIMRLHVEFVLENALQASNLLVPIQQSEISRVILKDNQLLAENIKGTYWSMMRSIMLLLAVIFLLVITALARLMMDLKKANQLANQAAETKSLFVSNMSHEIRTPMNGILGLTDILLNTELTAIQRNYLEKVRFSANALTTIINDILDFSKIESKKLHIEHVSFQFEDLLDNLRSLITPIANTKGIKLIFDLDPELNDHYVGDPVRINQIMLNFASNAVKFTEQGTVTLNVRKKRKAQDKEWVEISIIDTGIGIAEDKVALLFERFTQAESSTTRKYGGTGLGLTICKLLTELMHGEIHVESTVGQGSKFTVTLPLDTICNEEPEIVVNMQGSMLIVEDDPIYLEVSTNIARSLGLEVTGATRGCEAQLRLSESQFDILLLDWVLPDYEANELLKKLESLDVLPQRVVIYTAHTEEFIKTDLDYPILYKPLLKRDLIDVLTRPRDCTPGTASSSGGATGRDETAKPSGDVSSNVLQGSQLKVLLVEDNEINRIVALKLLGRIDGLEVDVAVNGQEAVEVINACDGAFDMVFMDIQMPVMDGVEATKVIRQSYDADTLTIIALTANVMQSEIDKYFAIGMNGHLGKPFKMSELEDVFKQHADLADQ